MKKIALLILLVAGFGLISLPANATDANINDSLPTVDSITPTSGLVGTIVTIMGSGFGVDCGSGHECSFSIDVGTDPLANYGKSHISNYVDDKLLRWDDSEIIFVVPDGAVTGQIHLAMYYDDNGFDEGGNVRMYNYFGPTFTVTEGNINAVVNGFAPKSGPTGTVVTITGTGFGNDCGGGYGCNFAVSFGAASVTNDLREDIVSWIDSEIKVKVPVGATTAAPVVSMYYDANGLDEGGLVKSYRVGSPYVFTVIGDGGGSPVSSAANVTSAFGCVFNTTNADEKTVKVMSLFTESSDSYRYFQQVYQAYYDEWKRYPRCTELQFHYNHTTPITRLTEWLQDNPQQTTLDETVIVNSAPTPVAKETPTGYKVWASVFVAAIVIIFIVGGILLL